ncbi:MAG: hypothetical protein Tsb0016_20740 [Sphingomonadales bacterium]
MPGAMLRCPDRRPQAKLMISGRYWEHEERAMAKILQSLPLTVTAGVVLTIIVLIIAPMIAG